MDLAAQQRKDTGKTFSRQLRKQGMIPGIIYGKNEPEMISMRTDYTQRYVQSLEGATAIFDLTIDTDGKSTTKKVMLQDYQFSNWGNRLLHVDLMEVDDNTMITTSLPIKITENCQAVKLGGVLQIVRRSIPIKCLVKDLPEFILVNVDDLLYGESVHVLDLDYSEGVKPVVRGRNYTIATVAGKTKEVEETDDLDAVEGGEAEAEVEKEK